MNLSSDLISQFVKATKNNQKVSTESTIQGTTVVDDGKVYVKLDGSDQLTPVTTTTDVQSGERVTVMIKDHTATITGNISSPAARTDDVKEIGNKITEAEILIADKVSTKELEAESARIDTLISDNVTIKEKLTASEAEIDKLVAEDIAINGTLTAQEAEIKKLDTEKLSATAADIKFATIEKLEAIEGEFHTLESTYGEFQELTTKNFEAVDATIKNLDAIYATIKDLEVEQARIDTLETESLTAESAVIKLLQSDVANIDTLIFGSASGTTIQSSFANAVIAQLGNAQIKSAMIDSLDASKLNAGTINTNNVNVQSEDGKLIISDETIQISDESRVRVQIGKDASGDYSISIWDADGKLMFSEGGITDNAIKDAIIRNDMVSEDANIAASKLDISSLFTEINNSTKTINSSKILMDADNQTLDVVFTQMSTDVDGLSNDVSSQGAAISVVQGKIDSKVWQEDIKTITDELGGEIDTLTTKQSTLEQTVNGINATVSSHTAEIANKADSSTVTAVHDKATEIEANLDGFKSTVSSTYSTKAEVDNIQIGGRNLFKRTGDFDSSIWSVKTKQPYELDSRYMQAAYETQYQDCCARTEKLGFTFADKTKTWTISAMFKGTKDGQMIGVTLDSNRIGWNKQAVPNGSWKKLVWTFKGSNTLSTFRFEANKGDLSVETPIYVAQIKCEYGNKATDWTPAPEDVDDDVKTLTQRVSNAETVIDQNTEAIELRATKKEVTETLGDYTTKEETEAAMTVQAEEISMEVSEKINDLQIGARNLIRNSRNLAFADYYFEGQEATVLTATHDGAGNVTLHGNTLVCTHDGAGHVILKY